MRASENIHVVVYTGDSGAANRDNLFFEDRFDRHTAANAVYADIATSARVSGYTSYSLYTDHLHPAHFDGSDEYKKSVFSGVIVFRIIVHSRVLVAPVVVAPEPSAPAAPVEVAPEPSAPAAPVEVVPAPQAPVVVAPEPSAPVPLPVVGSELAKEDDKKSLKVLIRHSAPPLPVVPLPVVPEEKPLEALMGHVELKPVLVTVRISIHGVKRGALLVYPAKTTTMEVIYDRVCVDLGHDNFTLWVRGINDRGEHFVRTLGSGRKGLDAIRVDYCGPIRYEGFAHPVVDVEVHASAPVSDAINLCVIALARTK